MVAVLVVWLWGVVLVPTSAAQGSQCPAANPTYNGPCGPEFTLPYWGNAGGWENADQYSTIQLADVLGQGRDQLIARSSAGVEIWEFDTMLGQWRPALDAQGDPMILTGLADPPPLSDASTNSPDTDWTLPQYYSTIQTGDVEATGRDQIIARSADGVVVYSYTPGPHNTPGSWQQTATNAFGGQPNNTPGWYPTIGTGYLEGEGIALLYGIDAGFALRALFWIGSGFQLAGGSGGSFPPGVQTDTLQASPEIGGQQELWSDTSQGMQGVRWTGRGWMPDVRAKAPFRFDSAEPSPQTLWDQWAYSQTIRFENVSGGSDVDLVGRGIDGLEAYRLTSSGWQQLATLSALSDANGFDQEKYWRTITYANLNGREDVVARGPNGVVTYTYDSASNSWSQMPGSIGLTDDPWGSGPSYYATFRAGDVDGDGKDELIARGPYGIRTWFYNRPGQPGWGPYLPQGAYPTFPGTSTSGQLAAYGALNNLARADGVLTGGENTVRAVWTGGNAPTGGQLTNLQSELVTLGSCTMSTQAFSPPQALTCGPPSGSSGFTAGDWTSVLNELFAELFDAQTVVDFYAQVDSARQKLFVGEGAVLPAIGSQLNLAAAADTPASFDPTELVSGGLQIAGSLTSLANPFIGAAVSISSAIVSMIPSASPTLTSPFQGTYAQLQTQFAQGIQEADKASASQNFQVRSDLNLMNLVTQLVQQGTWTFDQNGLTSVGNEAFAQWVYKSLLPEIYKRYTIYNCYAGAFNNYVYSCSEPPPGPWVGQTPSFAAYSFEDVEGFSQSAPCHEHLQGLQFECVFSGPDPGIVSTVSDPLSSTCTYTGNNPNTIWTFGRCSLGVPASRILQSAPILSSPEDTWNIPSVTGSPIPGLNVTGSAVRETRTRNASVHFVGSVSRVRRTDLRGARVAVDRVLTVPRHGELVRQTVVGLGGKQGSTTTSPLGSVTLRQSKRGIFQIPESASTLQTANSAGRGEAPSIRLKLTPGRHRSLAFRLDVTDVVMPSLPNVCGQTRARSAFRPAPFALTLQMRILRPAKRPLVISATPTYACRYDRSGTLLGLRVQRPPRPPKLGRGLSMRVRHPGHLTAGRPGILTATVRNPTSSTAQDVYVYVVLPRGLRVLGSTPRARITRRVVAWRLATLRRHRSRTVRLRVAPAWAGTAARCATVNARAMLRRSATATACIRVSPSGPLHPAGPPRVTG